MEKAPKYVNTLFIFLSHYCPLNCSYCYINDRNDTETITVETVGKALELYQDAPHVVFFGGEPLVHIELIDKIMEAYPQCHFQVVSSGYNLEEFISKERECLVQVSWDGVPKLASAHELERLSSKKGMQIRCVLHDGNIENMFDIYNQFKDWRVSKLPLLGDFTIAHVDERRDDYSEILSEQLELILSDYEKNPIYLPETISRWIRNTWAGGLHSSCDAGRYLALLPNGDIYPCVIMSQKKNCLLGNVNTEIDFSLLEEIFERPPECHGCTSPLCSGGCIIERNGSIAKHNCENMKVIEKVIRRHRINIVNENMRWIKFYLKEDC